jgi:hypothetical protein
MPQYRIVLLYVVLTFLLALPLLQARVISYAPYTNRPALPVIQSRTNRHFVLLEAASPQTAGYAIWSQVVVYDSTGQEEPRVVYPTAGIQENIVIAAVREETGAPVTILVGTYGTQYYGSLLWKLTTDGGASWKTVPLPSSTYFDYSSSGAPDVGGPFARARYSNIRIGTRGVPFVISIGPSTSNGSPLYAIRVDGSVKQWTITGRLIGSNKAGDRFLVMSGTDVDSLDSDGYGTKLATLSTSGQLLDGWLTADGAAYVNIAGDCCVPDHLWYLKDGAVQEILVGSDPRFGGTSAGMRFFEIPTADYAGAWIIKRATGKPTRLLQHTAQTGLAEQWQDITAPEVEAIHASAGGDKVLIQVHRPRAAIDTLDFKDPALAVWHVGDPAPRFYDELFLEEKTNKGFVHLDVDAVERNEPFVFDGGSLVYYPGGVNTSPSSGGGSDVFQEWGVVRGSLAQKLVVPGFGRTAGAFNSNWTTDVTFYNPNETAVTATLRFVRGDSATIAPILGDQTLQLAPREIRLVTDAPKTLFGVDSGVGALFITPVAGASLNATARTYTRSAVGTFGYGMDAIDTYAAASSRFPVTFCGAFQGQGFRTNVIVTDVSGRGTAATFSASDANGAMTITAPPIQTTSLGYQQTNGLESWLSVSSSRGALTVQPTQGEAVAAVFTIDNKTNDPTYFPPDLAASVTRTIPAIGHLDGLNGSKFRSDVYLFNNSPSAKYVTLSMKMWDSSVSSAVSITLQPNEVRVLTDILFSFFGRTGIARLRVTASGATTDTSIRVSSRTYTTDANGGTYGFLLPPLNSFQTASPGDILEILGPALDPGFRTNLGLVDMASSESSPARARVEVISATGGLTLDRFEITLPLLGGMQLNDLFRAHQLSHDGSPVLIRVTAINGMVGSYAATLDNGTNDSTYFAANLAAK